MDFHQELRLIFPVSFNCMLTKIQINNIIKIVLDKSFY